MGQSKSSDSSAPVFQQFAGAYGDTGSANSSRLAQQLEQMISGGGGGAYSAPLEQALLNPSYNPTSSSEQAMLNSIMDVTAGRGAVRGLGAPTQSALAQSVAPALIDLRKQHIDQLMGARGQNIGENQGNIQALMNLIGMAMPQVVGGNVSSGKSTGWKII